MFKKFGRRYSIGVVKELSNYFLFECSTVKTDRVMSIQAEKKNVCVHEKQNSDPLLYNLHDINAYEPVQSGLTRKLMQLQ